MTRRLLSWVPLLWFQACVAAPPCPPPEQPVLGQTLAKMNAARRGEDVMTCIRSISDEHDLSTMTDDVRYQLALQMSNAMSSLYDESKPLASDAREAVKLWGTYLAHASPPLDATRLNFGISKLIQQGRYLDFAHHLPEVLDGVAKAGALVEAKQSDLLFSTLKRCPEWSRVRTTLRCSAQCKEVVEGALGRLRAALGDPPWSGSTGMARLSANAQALNKESSECSTTH